MSTTRHHSAAQGLLLASLDSEAMFIADLRVAHKLLDSAVRAQAPEKARRFHALARSAFLDIGVQARDARLTRPQLERIDQELRALQARLDQFERGALP